MTDKGMPEKIWTNVWDVDAQKNTSTPYIRKDLADELAAALRVFMMSAHDYQSGLQEGEDALARYNAATEGK